MRDDYNAGTEGDILSNLEPAINYVKGKTSMELELYKASKSAVKDSVDQINNPFAPNDNNGMDRGNVRVLTREYPGAVHNNQQTVHNNSYSNDQFYGGYSSGMDVSSSHSSNNNGSIHALILISTAVLVVLVVLVSMFVMRFIGL